MIDYDKEVKEVRKAVLSLIHKGQTSHISSNFSCIDFATVLYNTITKNDEVVWSAGWKAATAYYFLAKQGKIRWDDVLEKFPNEPYLALLEPSTPGIHVMAGSMGHGLPVAVGMALARKREGKKGKIYVIMSDGEMNEGTTWESVMIAGMHRLDNLVVIVDCNKLQAMGRTKDILDLEPLDKKFIASLWCTKRVYGHDYVAVERALDVSPKAPYVIICDTHKGRGMTRTEQEPTKYHYQHVSDEMLAEL